MVNHRAGSNLVAAGFSKKVMELKILVLNFSQVMEAGVTSQPAEMRKSLSVTLVKWCAVLCVVLVPSSE